MHGQELTACNAGLGILDSLPPKHVLIILGMVCTYLLLLLLSVLSFRL